MCIYHSVLYTNILSVTNCRWTDTFLHMTRRGCDLLLYRLVSSPFAMFCFDWRWYCSWHLPSWPRAWLTRGMASPMIPCKSPIVFLICSHLYTCHVWCLRQTPHIPPSPFASITCSLERGWWSDGPPWLCSKNNRANFPPVRRRFHTNLSCTASQACQRGRAYEKEK